MAHQGTMIVDWEERIDPYRLRQERLDKARKTLRDSPADLLFVFRPEDGRYLTGHRHHLGPALILGNSVVILEADSEPILYTMDYEFYRKNWPWMDDDRILPRANFREEVGIREWAESLKQLLGDCDGKVIGVDLWTPTMEQHLRAVFPNSEFVDGYKILGEAKIIKTADEINCMKVANSMTEAAMADALDFLRPGVRECEVLAVAWKRMTELGSEWTQCQNIVASGPYTAPYRRFTSDRIIKAGDLVIIDIGACFNGYYGDLTRTWVCGGIEATPEQKQIHQNTYNALWAATDAARTGNTTGDVFKAAQPYVLDSLGHGSGTNPWEPPFFSPQSVTDPLELRPGMQFNIEPYDGTPGIGGVRLENNMVVQEEGPPEVYTTIPFDQNLLIDVHPLDKLSGRGWSS